MSIETVANVVDASQFLHPKCIETLFVCSLARSHHFRRFIFFIHHYFNNVSDANAFDTIFLLSISLSLASCALVYFNFILVWFQVFYAAPASNIEMFNNQSFFSSAHFIWCFNNMTLKSTTINDALIQLIFHDNGNFALMHIQKKSKKKKRSKCIKMIANTMMENLNEIRVPSQTHTNTNTYYGNVHNSVIKVT